MEDYSKKKGTTEKSKEDLIYRLRCVLAANTLCQKEKIDLSCFSDDSLMMQAKLNQMLNKQKKYFTVHGEEFAKVLSQLKVLDVSFLEDHL